VSKDTLTNYRSKKGTDEFYTLGAIWFCVVAKNLPYTEYLSKCTEEGVPRVSLIDRKPLIQYVTGETHTMPYLDLTVPVPHDWIKTRLKRLNEEPMHKYGFEDSHEVAVDKYVRLDTAEAIADTSDADATTAIIQLLRKRERVSRDCASVLRSKNTTFTYVLNTWKEAINGKISENKLDKHQVAAYEAKTSTGNYMTGKANHIPSQGTSISTYNRYEVVESDFWKERIREFEPEFLIDTKASYLPNMPQSAGVPVDQRHVAGSQASVSLSQFPPPSRPLSSTVSAAPTVRIVSMPSDKDAKIPIILVPAATTSLITLYNAKSLLEKEV
jgi:parafibromin